MVSRLMARLTFPNVVAVLALFVGLGGSAYAAGVLPVNSVGTPQLKGGSVTSGKVKDGTLKAVDFARNQLKVGPRGSAGPAGPAGPDGGVDASHVYTRAQSDARFLRGGLVTVVASTTVAADAEGGVSPTCPAGYQAVSGGADSSNVGEVYLTGFGPQVEGSSVAALGDGQHGAPTAWRGFVRKLRHDDADVQGGGDMRSDRLMLAVSSQGAAVARERAPAAGAVPGARRHGLRSRRPAGQQCWHATVEGRLGDERQGQGRHAQGRRPREGSTEGGFAGRSRPGRTRRPCSRCRYVAGLHQAESETRYLHGGLVTVVASVSIPSTGNTGTTATCPAGYQVISGGSEAPDNKDVFLLSSEPVIEGSNVISLSDGLHGAPTAWRRGR